MACTERYTLQSTAVLVRVRVGFVVHLHSLTENTRPQEDKHVWFLGSVSLL